MRFFVKVLHIVVVLICMLLQLTFVGYLNVFHISLDLVMIALIGITLTDGYIYGILAGFFAGLSLI